MAGRGQSKMKFIHKRPLAMQHGYGVYVARCGTGPLGPDPYFI